MKRFVSIVLPVALLLAMLMPSAALAEGAGNTTAIEQKWLDFQKVLTDQMVKDNKLTKQEADNWMQSLRAKFAESPGDTIYEMFSDKMRRDPGSGSCKDGKCRRGGASDEAALRVYSMLTGRTADDLKAQCTQANQTIWDLAKKEGKLDALKQKIYDAQAASLDALVKGGAMTDAQRTDRLKHLQSELDGK